MAAFLRPKSLAGTRGEVALAAVCVVVLCGLFAFDAVTPAAVTFSGLFVLPSAAAAWLGSGRMAAAVAALAVVMLAVLAGFERVVVVTAASRCLSVLLIALLGHLAASSTLDARQVRERQLRVLLDTAARLRGEPSVSGVLAVATAMTASFVSHGGGDEEPRAAVWRIEGDDLVAAAENESRSHVLGVRARLDAPLRRLIGGLGPRSFAVMELPAEMQDVLQAAGVREVAMAPIVVRGSAWGVLSAGALDERDFETSELDLLAGIADLTGLGLGAAGAGGLSPSTG